MSKTLRKQNTGAALIPNNPTRGDYVFVSYSRKNSDIAREVIAWLKSNDMDAWIDAQNISPNENWWNAICEGIRGSIAVVFILTPEIVKSIYSHLELDYALAQGKEVIFLRCIEPADADSDRRMKDTYGNISALQPEPSDEVVVTRILGARKINDVARANWDIMSQKNWVLWAVTRPSADHVGSLVSAIRTNIEFKQLHRKLSIQADEWDAKKRPSRLRLRGAELRKAVEWAVQAEAPDTHPRITPLQRDYIRASRRAQNRYSRFVALLTVLIISLLSTLFVSERIARGEAQQREYEAVIARHEAQARAEEAIAERNNAQNVLQTFAMVDNTIKQPVGTSPRPPLLFGTDLWVSNYEDGTVMQLAADTGQPRQADPILVGRGPLTPLTDGRYVWVVNSEDSTITRLDPQTPNQPVMIEVGDDPRSLFVIGRWMWVTAGGVRNKQLVQVDRETTEVAQSVEIGQINGEVTFDGTYLWVSIADPRQPSLVRIDAVTGARLQIEMEHMPRTPIAAFGSVWITQQDSTTLLRLDTASGALTQSYDLGVELSPPQVDDRWLWLRTDTGILQFEPEAGMIARQFPVITSRPIFREGNRLWVFSEGTLYAYDVNTGQALFNTELSGDYTTPIVVGDNLWLANTHEDVIVMINTATGEERRALPNCDAPTQPVFDGANLWLACRDENAIARIPVLISYYGANALSANPDPYTPVYIEVEGHPYLWIVQQGTGQLVQFDALNGRVLAIIPVGQAPLPPIYDGERYIWVASSTGGLLTRIDTKDVRIYSSMSVDIAEIAYIEWLKGKVWLSGGSSDPLTDVGAPDLVVIDPVRMRIIREHEFGIGASRTVYDERYDVVWVSGTAISGGTAYRLNADTGAILTEERIGYVSYEPVLNGDDAWISSLYPMEAEDMFTAVLQANSGALYRLNRETGQRIGDPIDLDELPSLPLIAGDYLWITQGSFELETISGGGLIGVNETGANPRGVIAIGLDTGEFVGEPLQPCRNVGTPFYDDQGGYIWGICIGFADSQHQESGNIFVIDPETRQMVAEYTGLGRFPWPAQIIDGQIWIVFQESNNVAVFDRSTAALLRVFGVGAGASRLTYDGGDYAWLSNGDDGTVQRIMVRFP